MSGRGKSNRRFAAEVQSLGLPNRLYLTYGVALGCFVGPDGKQQEYRYPTAYAATGRGYVEFRAEGGYPYMGLVRVSQIRELPKFPRMEWYEQEFLAYYERLQEWGRKYRGHTFLFVNEVFPWEVPCARPPGEAEFALCYPETVAAEERVQRELAALLGRL